MPPQPLQPLQPAQDSQRAAAGSPPSLSQRAPDDVELILDLVDVPPLLMELEQRVGGAGDSTWSSRLNGATVDENHDGADGRTASPTTTTTAAGDVDADAKTETLTAESDRPTTSLLHGAASGDGGQSRAGGRCRCCAVQ